MNAEWIIFWVLQGLSLLVMIAIMFAFLRHQKDRAHIFSLMGNTAFSEHQLVAKMLGACYVICTIAILVGGAFFLLSLNTNATL